MPQNPPVFLREGLLVLDFVVVFAYLLAQSLFGWLVLVFVLLILSLICVYFVLIAVLSFIFLIVRCILVIFSFARIFVCLIFILICLFVRVVSVDFVYLIFIFVRLVLS